MSEIIQAQADIVEIVTGTTVIEIITARVVGDAGPRGIPGAGGVLSIEEGSGISVDDTDPQHPIVSASAADDRAFTIAMAVAL